MDASPPPSIVLLPGLDGTGRLFAPFIAELQNDFTVKAVAYPRDRVLSEDQLVTFIERSLPADGDYVLLGESFSGPFALRAAERSPKGLVGLVLVATFVRCPITWLPPWARVLAGPALFRFPAPRWILRRYLTGKDDGSELVGDLAAAMRSVRPEVLASRIRAVLSVDATEALRRCPVPALYLQGSRDRLVRRSVSAKLSAINPALLRVEVDAPHLVLQRNPTAAARAVRTFVRSLRT